MFLSMCMLNDQLSEVFHFLTLQVNGKSKLNVLVHWGQVTQYPVLNSVMKKYVESVHEENEPHRCRICDEEFGPNYLFMNLDQKHL